MEQYYLRQPGSPYSLNIWWKLTYSVQSRQWQVSEFSSFKILVYFVACDIYWHFIWTTERRNIFKRFISILEVLRRFLHALVSSFLILVVFFSSENCMWWLDTVGVKPDTYMAGVVSNSCHGLFILLHNKCLVFYTNRKLCIYFKFVRIFRLERELQLK
jgi:hypothetical protein